MNKTFWVQPEENPAAYLSQQDLQRFIAPGEFSGGFHFWALDLTPWN